MKIIIARNGLEIMVDNDDYIYLSEKQWSVVSNHITSYAYRHENKKTVWMHRQIMKTPDDMQVDHVDHNGLNNQKSNLRNCTHKENCRNKISTGKVNYLGVTRDNRNRIRASICVDGRKIDLCLYKNITDAAMAYDKAAKEHFGEFANLNFKEVKASSDSIINPVDDLELAYSVFKKALFKKILDSPELQSMIDAKVQQKLDALHINKEYYTPEEYGIKMKIKTQTVYKLCRDKHLPYERVGNSIRIFDLK